MKRSVLEWEFPLPRTHTGIALGNGTQGVLVWGNEILSLTIGRAGFWDHRGGKPFCPATTMTETRRLLEAGDFDGLVRAFAPPSQQKDGRGWRPQQYGCGRIDLALPDGLRPRWGRLDPASATLEIGLASDTGATATLTIRQAIDEELVWVAGDRALMDSLVVTAVPTWRYIGEVLTEKEVQPPVEWADNQSGGFLQELPADDGLACAWCRSGDQLRIATALGGDARARAEALAACDDACVRAAAARTEKWWRRYTDDVPVVSLPDPVLQRAWDYNLYRQAGLSNPDGVPATLQGPWMEEYQTPPWSNDYHFNINVQMVYMPACATNRQQHLDGIWRLLTGWTENMREAARSFFGRDDALMLPHALDDRCQAVYGAFWTGAIDQACIGWMAVMAWKHYRYSLRHDILTEVAWPLLRGAFNGYWAMLEEVKNADGQTALSLPVSVSPEFGGTGLSAWGRDASFQLACLHAVADALIQAAPLVAAEVDSRWCRVRSELPPYTTIGKPGHEHIALWQGQDLTYSHRHHSHLAAIYPFQTIDPADPRHHEVVRNSLRHWVTTGPGQWTGWCIPWAAILCARCGLADAAVTWLHWWHDVYVNEGDGTLHDAGFAGCGAIDGGRLSPNFGKRPGEVMQMDAAMGYLMAVCELLVQTRGDVVHILPAGVPKRWRRLHFDGIRVEGAFSVGATVEDGGVVEVRIVNCAGRPNPVRVAHGLGSSCQFGADVVSDAVFAIELAPGQQIELRRTEPVSQAVRTR